MVTDEPHRDPHPYARTRRRMLPLWHRCLHTEGSLVKRAAPTRARRAAEASGVTMRSYQSSGAHNITWRIDHWHPACNRTRSNHRMNTRCGPVGGKHPGPMTMAIDSPTGSRRRGEQSACPPPARSSLSWKKGMRSASTLYAITVPAVPLHDDETLAFAVARPPAPHAIACTLGV